MQNKIHQHLLLIIHQHLLLIIHQHLLLIIHQHLLLIMHQHLLLIIHQHLLLIIHQHLLLIIHQHLLLIMYVAGGVRGRSRLFGLAIMTDRSGSLISDRGWLICSSLQYVCWTCGVCVCGTLSDVLAPAGWGGGRFSGLVM